MFAELNVLGAATRCTSLASSFCIMDSQSQRPGISNEGYDMISIYCIPAERLITQSVRFDISLISAHIKLADDHTGNGQAIHRQTASGVCV